MPILGLVGFVALGSTVSLDVGILFCVGLGLGVLNSQLVQRSLVRAVTDGRPDRKTISFGMLRRLSLSRCSRWGSPSSTSPTACSCSSG